MTPPSAEKTPLLDSLRSRILTLDGAMGTMLLSAGLTEPDCELVSQCPDVIADIHQQYIAAGADIIRTATFQLGNLAANRADRMDYIRRVATDAVILARSEAEKSGRKVFIAGCIGPISPDAAHDDIADTFALQYEAFAKAGADLLAVETAHEPESTEAALNGLAAARRRYGNRRPIMLSITPLGNSPESRTSQIRAFKSIADRVGDIEIIGLNCGADPTILVSHLDDILPTPRAISICPSCGLPDSDGRYGVSPEEFATTLEPAMAAGKVNIAGGCCGTTPAHIAALSNIAKSYHPHII